MMDCPTVLNKMELSKDNKTTSVVQDILSMQIAKALNVGAEEVICYDSVSAETVSCNTESSLTTTISSTTSPIVQHVTAVADSVPVTLPIASPGISGSPPITPLTPPVTPKAQVKRSVEKNIATLVFFDLETTGLPHVIGKSNVQITELSMIAMNRREYEKSTSTDLRDVRIIHKLCMCFRPRVMISQGAAKITGLDNYNLADEQPFNHNGATSIISFLTHLPKPVCLLAHNGFIFDYPVLKAELKRVSTQLPYDILIADTLKAFKAVGVPAFPPTKKVCKSVKLKNGKVSCALDNLHLYFFNKKPPGSHSSEGDCIALAKVCHVMKDAILPWIDENCLIMDMVNPMW